MKTLINKNTDILISSCNCKLNIVVDNWSDKTSNLKALKLLLLPHFKVLQFMEEMATSDPHQLLIYIICSSLSKIKAVVFLVTYSSREVWTDTEWNQF